MKEKTYIYKDLEVGPLYQAIYGGRPLVGNSSFPNLPESGYIPLYSDSLYLYFNEHQSGLLNHHKPFMILEKRISDFKTKQYEIIKVLTVEGEIGWCSLSSIARHWDSENIQQLTEFKKLTE